MAITPPCKGCSERYLGCHAGCESYKEYRAKKDQEIARRQAESDANEVAIRARYRTCKFLRNRKGGKND